MNTRQCVATVAAACALLAGNAWADDIKGLQNLGQSDFRLASKELVSAATYRGLAPAEPLGLIGFDVSVGVTGVVLKNPDVFARAAGTSKFSDVLFVPGLRVQKGLPGGFDIGAMVSGNSGGIRNWGGELRWAWVDGNFAIPAIAIRGALSRMSIDQQLTMNTRSIDISISKGLLNFTPYAGIGRVWADSKPAGGTALQEESLAQTRLYAGLNVNLLVNFALEVDKMGENVGFSVKTGFRF